MISLTESGVLLLTLVLALNSYLLPLHYTQKGPPWKKLAYSNLISSVQNKTYQLVGISDC